MKVSIPGSLLLSMAIAIPVSAHDASKEEALNIVYPPREHNTRATQIFLIGTSSPKAPVTINGKPIEYRSPDGHFAPSVPLKIGQNVFDVQSGAQTITLRINRVSNDVTLPETFGFEASSLEPSASISRLPSDPICFRAIATPGSNVSARLGGQTVTLLPPGQAVALPPNSAVLTANNSPQSQQASGIYQGCTFFSVPGLLGQPEFVVSREGQQIARQLETTVTILNPADISMVEVTAEQGVARTGPSTSYSRLTPLPKGTQARVTATEAEWLRLDYGAWIKRAETQAIASSGPVTSIIRSLKSRQAGRWTEVVLPMQHPVPVTVEQGDRDLTLTLHNTIAQTDTIFVPPDEVIERLDWSQPNATDAQYRFQLKSDQSWGYKLRYDDTSLILSLRHPPTLSGRSLRGAKILLDAGHGSPNDLGARGPTGYPEKDVALIVTKLLRDELEKKGATVVMTREGDDDLWPHDRVEVIEATEPDLALSLHYNALPDNGDALNTKGIGTFWYHQQAYDFSVYIHDYLTQELGREAYGVFWNNLALTRPSVAPSILLELGFMINPDEFEWITDSKAQVQLSKALADGISDWFHRQI
ncbi:MAG: N-acetylmuramoyl-L-alanine amidase [Cyanobacteria bacterium P01_F01_bin.42]